MAVALAVGALKQSDSADAEPLAMADPPCQFGHQDPDRQAGPGGTGAPDMAALLADNKFTVAALFGRMDEGSIEEDKGSWSQLQFEQYLRSIGMEQIGDETDNHGNRWTRFVGSIKQGTQVHVDILGPSELSPRDASHKVGEAIASALRNHELVYFNGHSMRGSIKSLSQAETYRVDEGDVHQYGILVLDACWSTQLYSLPVRVAAAQVRRLDIISNDTVSVTGSIHSFVALLKGLLLSASKSTSAPWQGHLQRMNELAQARARERSSRSPETRFLRPESYRLAKPCAL